MCAKTRNVTPEVISGIAATIVPINSAAAKVCIFISLGLPVIWFVRAQKGYLHVGWIHGTYSMMDCSLL
jgi:hypothetical protein